MGAAVGTFGETGTFTPINNGSPGTPQSVPVIFNEMFTEIDANEGLQIITPKPNAGIRLTDFDTKPKIGDKINIRSQDYLIESVRDDGEAGSLLLLDKQ